MCNFLFNGEVMTVNELIEKLQELQRVGMGNRIVVCEASLSGEKTLFETQVAGGIYLEKVSGAMRQRYAVRRAGYVDAVIIH